MIKIRLARGGRIHYPVYTIVATNSRSPRNGRFLEKLGQYNPHIDGEGQVSGIKTDSIKAWIGKGAAMSDTVRNILKKNKVEL